MTLYPYKLRAKIPDSSPLSILPIGPFTWLSAFRSQAVQNQLKSGAGGASAASQAASKSFHSLGMAGDIVPKTMTAEAFFAKIAADSTLKNMLGEIALKNTALHISLSTPTKQGVLMFVDKAGSYIRYKADEVAAILKKYQKQVAIGGGAIVLIGLGIFLFLKMRKK
jgi:hypothetical protein